MKLIINTSTLSGTGVTQVATSFIKECVYFTENEYHVFLSQTVKSQLDLSTFPSNFKFYFFSAHPFFGLKGFKIRRQLRETENKINADCVFSVFGPSYWTPKTPHLMGYAYPHYVYPDSPFFNVISLREKLIIHIYKIFHKYFLLKNGTYYCCETEDVSRRLTNYLKISANNIFTVSNTYNDYFISVDKVQNETILPAKEKNEFRFLCLYSFAKHKNLEVLNEVIPHYQKVNGTKNIKFVLTVDNNLLQKKLHSSIHKFIYNLGRIDVEKCPQVYNECDAIFLPTLLECFTANYPEAMIMEKPILTSNLSFAENICKDAAIYFNPLDVDDIVKKIELITENKGLYDSLVNYGKKRVMVFDSAHQRAEKYLNICKKMVNNED